MSIPADDAAAYPVFTADQLDRLRAYGTVRSVRAGEVLFSPADDTYDLLVVLSGEVEVTEEARGERVRFKPHRLGSFVGELNLLTGQRPFHTARVIADADILTISHAQLRVLLDRETEIADVLVRALIARRGRRVAGDVSSAAIEIIGTAQSAQTLALRTFLGRNTIAYRWVDADQVDGLDDYLSAVGVTRRDLPVVITPNRVLPRAGPAELGRVLGLVRRSEDDRLYDVVVVGAGPAGLAAAVYGASEGLDIAVFDGTAPGGQAGTSSRIENYLGFPDGISGAELTTRAAIQAQRFGARLTSPSRVEGISAAFDGFAISLAGGGVVSARTVVAACGARYRRLPAASSVVSAVNGIHHLESVELRDTRSGEVKRFDSRGLFCFIGAEPASGWLPQSVTRDENGFVLTDVSVPADRTLVRPRLPYETAMDGLFAAGDIRVGSMKRVAAAVGEGSSAIRSVHQYLAQFPDRDSVG